MKEFRREARHTISILNSIVLLYTSNNYNNREKTPFTIATKDKILRNKVNKKFAKLI